MLEEEGFITRTPSASDKRILELHPTQKTLDLLPSISPILSRWEACLTSDLTDEEKETVERILERMKEKASCWMENH